MKELIHEKLWDFLESSPREVKEFLLNNKTSIAIFDMCENLGIEDDKIHYVSQYIVLTAMGEIKKEELALAFELDLGISSDISKKLVLEIEEQIFSKMKLYLLMSKRNENTTQTENNFSKQSHIFKDSYKEECEG